MNTEYYEELEEAYSHYNKYYSKLPLLVPSHLFNMPYRYVNESAVRSFMSIYIRFHYNAFSTLYREKLSKSMIKEFNTTLKEAAYKNSNMAEAIHTVLISHKNYLQRLGEEVYQRQHPMETKEPNFFGVVFKRIADLFSGGK